MPEPPNATPALPADRRPAREDAPYVFAFLAALLTRTLAAVAAAPSTTGAGAPFEQYAMRIAAGVGFGPSSLLPPLYPFFVGLLYRVYGFGILPVAIVQSLLGALAVLPAMFLARAAGLSRGRVLAVGLVLAFLPQAVGEVRHLTPQILVSALLTAAAAVWLRGSGPPGRVESALAGAGIGLACLGRAGMVIPGMALLFLGGRTGRAPEPAEPVIAEPQEPDPAEVDAAPGTWPAVDWDLPSRPDLHVHAEPAGAASREPAASAPAESGSPQPFELVLRFPPPDLRVWARRGIALACLMLVLAPWTARNTRLHHRPALVDNTWALRLRASTLPRAERFRYKIPSADARVPDNLILTDNNVALSELLGYAATDPAGLAHTMGRRVLRFLSFSARSDMNPEDPFPYRLWWFRLLQSLLYGTLATLALSWLILCRASGRVERACAWVVAGTIVLAAVTGGTGDARLYAAPFLAVTAARGTEGFKVLLPGEGELIGLRPALFMLATIAFWVHGMLG